MEVIRYEEKYEQHFIDLNQQWIKEYFDIESQDTEQLENVDIYLKQGGMVFFAIEYDFVLSTIMVIERQLKVWEICKFATNKEFQGAV